MTNQTIPQETPETEDLTEDSPEAAEAMKQASFLPEETQKVKTTPKEKVSEDEEEEPEDAVDEPDPKQKRKEEKKAAISQAKWQEMVEKSKDFDAFKESLKEALGIEEDESEPEDLTKALTKKVSSLEAEVARSKYEAKNSAVISKEYASEWEKVNADERLNSLTYDEKWKLIRKPEQDKGDRGSPPSSKSTVTTSEEDDLEEFIREMRKVHPLMTREQMIALSS